MASVAGLLRCFGVAGSVVLIVLTCGAMGACQASTEPNQSAVRRLLLDRTQPLAQRLEALRIAELNEDSEAGRDNQAALRVLAWSDRHAAELRGAAIDRLLESDAEAFWSRARTWLPKVDDPRVRRSVAERAAAADRRELLGAFLGRWALDATATRLPADWDGSVSPERWAVERLGGGRDVDRVLRDAVGGEDLSTAVAAWTVLSAIVEPDELRAELAEWPASSPLVVDLKAAAEVLGELPGNAEQLRWWSAVAADDARWGRLKERAARLPASVRREVALRHLSLLNANGSAFSDASSRAGRDQLNTRMASAKTVERADRDASGPRSAVLDAARARAGLSTPDRALVGALLAAMDRPGVRAAWFEQAERDRLDGQSEHGGVLAWTATGQPVARWFPPESKRGDHRFVSSEELIRASYFGLAHYHFHAQQHDNTEFAGPGRGDLAFARVTGLATVVLTYIDRETLNVDLGLPDGTTLDLGLIRRPGPRNAGRK